MCFSGVDFNHLKRTNGRNFVSDTFVGGYIANEQKDKVLLNSSKVKAKYGIL